MKMKSTIPSNSGKECNERTWKRVVLYGETYHIVESPDEYILLETTDGDRIFESEELTSLAPVNWIDVDEPLAEYETDSLFVVTRKGSDQNFVIGSTGKTWFENDDLGLSFTQDATVVGHEDTQYISARKDERDVYASLDGSEIILMKNEGGELVPYEPVVFEEWEYEWGTNTWADNGDFEDDWETVVFEEWEYEWGTNTWADDGSFEDDWIYTTEPALTRWLDGEWRITISILQENEDVRAQFLEDNSLEEIHFDDFRIHNNGITYYRALKFEADGYKYDVYIDLTWREMPQDTVEEPVEKEAYTSLWTIDPYTMAPIVDGPGEYISNSEMATLWVEKREVRTDFSIGELRDDYFAQEDFFHKYPWKNGAYWKMFEDFDSPVDIAWKLYYKASWLNQDTGLKEEFMIALDGTER